MRLVLAIPHLVWAYVWGAIALLAAIASWFATLARGRSPQGLHDFLAAYLRYTTWVWSYFFLIAGPFPPFSGRLGDYVLDVEIDPPERQNRWTVGFRLILIIPAWLIWSVLETILEVIAVFGWFVGLVLGRMPEGMRNFAVFCVGYRGLVFGYLMLLTARYPAINFPRPG